MAAETPWTTPGTVGRMPTDELMDHVCPIIKDNGWVYYFAEETDAVAKSLGLDIGQFYFLGRGGTLGDVEAELVISSFGYFNPDLIRSMWNAARSVVAPVVAARAHFSCCAEVGRARLSDVAGLDDFCAAAAAVNEAADYVGLPLYAGFRSQALVDDVPGRSLQLVALLRELRGGAHLLAVRASGVDPRKAHLITRPGDQAMFGWSEEDAPAVGPAEREAMAAAERLTDQLVRPAYAALDDRRSEALRLGVDRIAAALAR